MYWVHNFYHNLTCNRLDMENQKQVMFCISDAD